MQPVPEPPTEGLFNDSFKAVLQGVRLSLCIYIYIYISLSLSVAIPCGP